MRVKNRNAARILPVNSCCISNLNSSIATLLVTADLINRIAPPTDIKIPEGTKILSTYDSLDCLEFEYNEPRAQKIELRINENIPPQLTFSSRRMEEQE